MDHEEIAGWPHGRWELSAAESYALLHGPRTSKPSQPFKLAVLELVSRRVLELVEVEKSGFFRMRRVAVLKLGEGETYNEILLEARDLYLSCHRTAYPEGFRAIEVKTLAEQARRQYSSNKGFAEAVVMKSLAERGLYRREQKNVLRIIPYQRWVLTRSGEAAKAQLTMTVRLGESQFSRWVDRQPNRALAYLGLVGPAILLMEPLHPALKRLSVEYESGGFDGGSPGSVDGGGSSDEREIEFDGLDLDFSAFDLDFDVLGDIDSAFEAIDSGVDAGVGDGGGGDGGGGD